MRRFFRFFAVWAARAFAILLVIPVLALVEPFFHVRLTHIYSDRIGHFCFNTHIFAARQRMFGKARRAFRLIFAWNPCNRTLFEMWRRVIPIRESRALAAFYHYTKDIGLRTRFYDPMPHQLTDYREINHNGPLLSFTDSENVRGRDLLEKMGIGPDDWFMAFHARDESFHKGRSKGVQSSDKRRHRNSDILTYLEAARRVAARGGFAIRMGSVVEKPLPTDAGPRIVDYASRFRSDFGDIYLSGKCRFFLGGSSGLHSVPPLFDIPVAMANQIPGIPVALRAKSRYIHKLLLDKSTGELLPFRAWRELGLFSLEKYHQWDLWESYGAHGLDVIDNTPEDIADLAEEMLDIHAGRPLESEALRLQQLFADRFVSHFAHIDQAPRLGARFALKHRHLIEA